VFDLIPTPEDINSMMITNEKRSVKGMKAIQFTCMFIWVFFCAAALACPAFAAKGPTETIKPVLEDLTTLLNNSELQGNVHRDERRKRIMTTIKTGFDFQEMCKRVLGRTWLEINQAEKEHFTELMTKLLENAYIGKLEDYHFKGMEYVEEKVQDDRAQVTTLVEKDNVKLPVHYILQQTPKGWMVYDINIEGVSLVRNYMEQFRSILRTDSFQGLVKVIEEKNKTFEKSGTD
jgi:phospholipid transport system substrate-binding protein